MKIKSVLAVFLMSLSTSACAEDLIRVPCDDAVDVIHDHYEKYRKESDISLLAHGGRPRIFYRMMFEDAAVPDAELRPLLSNKAQLQDSLAGLATAGRTEQLRRLLSMGVSPDARVEHDAPILGIAAQCKRTDTVEMLLNAGADVQAHNVQNMDVMAVAILEDLNGVAHLLVAHGYRAEAGTPSGDITLRLARRLHGGKYIKLLGTEK